MHTTDPHHGHAPAAGPGYELRDAKIRPLVEAGVVLVVLCVASFWSMVWFHDFLKGLELAKEARGTALTTEREVPPAPLLEVTPGIVTEFGRLEVEVFKTSGLGDVRQAEAARLSSYGWIDEQAKLVHIPIEQAMQKLLEKGLPVRK